MLYSYKNFINALLWKKSWLAAAIKQTASVGEVAGKFRLQSRLSKGNSDPLVDIPVDVRIPIGCQALR
jgi:hypothetical protein